ncbi:MAG TPA: methyl-accepting chemotaxis protein [Steroidobacteraceae bacterium]|nr:methyl-accepting chemotaxis protein [Steroidobacteraceae bacterium]
MVNLAERHAAARWMPVMLVTGLAVTLVAAVLVVLAGRAQQHESGYRAHLSRLTVLAGALPAQAADAGRGDAGAFERLAASRTELERVLGEIESGRGAFDALSSPSALKLGNEPGWNAVLETSAQVLAARDAAGELKSWAEESRAALGRVLAGTGDAVAAPGGAAALRALPRFETVAQRTGDDLAALAGTVTDPAAATQRISENTALLAQFLAGLAGQDASAGVPAVTGQAAGRLAALRETFAQYEDRVRGTLERAGALATAQRAAADLAAATDSIAKRLEAQAGGQVAAARFGGTGAALVAIAVAVLAFAGALLAWISASGLRRAAEIETERNRRNQDAILRLLDEMSSLADGDLTVQATVTDDITGAIADSINYAIEALRELVATINDTAVHLDAAARQTQAAAGHLAKASVAQSRQVAAATDAVGAMATSIEEVSGNAERSADVARHAVDVAHKGGDAVRRTIDGMNTIRENIQDTSKRIKRLGESSQEIGNIVELINDIAEQTNILALNASIQASMAGESGRGFAVVADEVQRLAERAGHATRQIEVLVRTIQTDTNEAVVSMERTTTDVVGGALLAENAGAALGEIEDVSNQIAQLVQNISASARQQAATSAHISRTMQVLREISQQSADNTSATSTAIGRLAEMSAQLRKSAAGFRLPQQLPPQGRKGKSAKAARTDDGEARRAAGAAG